MNAIPIVDVTPLVTGQGNPDETVRAIDRACRDIGVFAVTGHGIDPELPERLSQLSREFFALGEDKKSEIAMSNGGVAWRGWFPLGGELTSGIPDQKEGIYFGAELTEDDPRVSSHTPMHGANLFPKQPVALRAAVLEYIDQLTNLAHAVTRGVSLALGIDVDWLRSHFFEDPLVLLRVFRYPPIVDELHAQWSVGEHTDYGFLTLLHQDDSGGLQVKTSDQWIDVDPMPNVFICNLGDMLDRLTAGAYRSTPHRVINRSGSERISIPFFFDPGWNTVIASLPGTVETGDDRPRWDGVDIQTIEGTYGDYVYSKVSKVFPKLRKNVDEP